MTRMILLLTLCLASIASADRIVLTDGTSLEGRVRKSVDGNWVIVTTDGKITSIDATRVARVEVTGGADAASADKLASLKRSVESLSNLDEIIQRFERFAAANAGSAAGTDAEAELATWRARKSRGLIKVGGDWITPEQKVQLLRQIDPKIAQAQQLIISGQLNDAQAVIAEVLTLDSSNLAANYLNGMVSFQSDKFAAARKSFEAVNAQIAEHAPTLNNLAVVAFKQNQVGPSLALYDQALAAAPADRVIVDNVAEAIAALKDEHRRLAGARKLERRFAEQDAVLSARMQQQGQYRWGATFVDKRKFDELVAAEKAIKDKIDEMNRDYEAMNAQIAVIERQIETTERELKRIEADSYYIDNRGNFIRRPLPSYYFDQQREVQALAGNRAQLQAQQKSLRQHAQRIQQDLPVPKFTGVQKLIGIEGTPLESLESASTQPAGRL